MDPIIFTRDAGQELAAYLKGHPLSDVFILVDRNTEALCLGRLGLQSVRPGHLIRMHGGEQAKTLDETARVWKRLSDEGARRDSILVNLGGGVVTDLGGFAASCFKRGIRFLNIPTTLLAQVDASVGGKTGVDFNGLKNEIGCFAQPERVFVDNGFLTTLPVRQILSGYAEMLKHGLLAGEKHLRQVTGQDPLRLDRPEGLALIRESVSVKAHIVEEDPREKGIRKALNFGHTVGHAIEAAALERGIGICHGEAVAYGMLAELWLSVVKAGFGEGLFEEMASFIRSVYPPCPDVGGEDLLYGLMLHDKKNTRPGVNFSLLHAPGDVETDCYCSREDVCSSLHQIWNGIK